MTDSATYNVICTGEIFEVFDSAQVYASFAKLFKLSEEKAVEFLSSERVLKKELAQDKAQTYVDKLTSIGVVAVLQENTAPKPPPPSEGLSLEPIEEEPPAVESVPAHEETEHSASAGHHASLSHAASEAPTEAPLEQLEDKLNVAAIGAAVVAALVGAFVWKFIAVTFEYELGVVAWGIGGLVGFAAAAMSSRGQLSGIVCGVLALFAIVGGKYMATAAFQEQWLDTLNNEFQGEEYQEAFAYQQTIAQSYLDTVKTDDDLRVFMVENAYTEAMEPQEITQQEIDDFRQYIEPSILSMAEGNFNMETWLEDTFESGMEDVSTMDLMIEDFGGLNFLFLLLGVGTAFKLGSGYGKEEAA